MLLSYRRHIFFLGSVPRLPLFPYSQWFHAVSPIARARGVSIAFGKMCPLTSISVKTDPEGGVLFIKGILHGQGYTFASTYALNTHSQFSCEDSEIARKIQGGVFDSGGGGF